MEVNFPESLAAVDLTCRHNELRCRYSGLGRGYKRLGLKCTCLERRWTRLGQLGVRTRSSMAVSGTRSHRGGKGGHENARWPEPGAAVQHGRHKSRDWPWQGLAFAAAATQWGRWKPPRWPEPGAAVQQSNVREQWPQQSTVRERRSVWRGPQHPFIEGG